LAIRFAARAETEPREVARALVRGDADVIGRLVMQYHYRLLRYLVYLTGQRERAEDLVQETWIRVLERAGRYDGRSRFEPWLFSIARNLAIDELRRRQRTGTETEEEAAGVAAPDGDSPFAAAAKSEDAARVAGAMQALEPIYREALLLRFQEEMSLEEIAQIAAAPVSTVSSRIHRGLAMLRAELEGAGDAK